MLEILRNYPESDNHVKCTGKIVSTVYLSLFLALDDNPSIAWLMDVVCIIGSFIGMIGARVRPMRYREDVQLSM